MAKIRYPKLTWMAKQDGTVMALNNDFSLICRLRVGGESAGTWSALINDTSLTSGRGKFGYEFDDQHHATGALEQAMRDAIDARVKYAKQVLVAYT